MTKNDENFERLLVEWKELVAHGPTLRDQFAMAALPAVVADYIVLDAEKAAREAYLYADAMLVAREEDKSQP